RATAARQERCLARRVRAGGVPVVARRASRRRPRAKRQGLGHRRDAGVAARRPRRLRAEGRADGALRCPRGVGARCGPRRPPSGPARAAAPGDAGASEADPTLLRADHTREKRAVSARRPYLLVAGWAAFTRLVVIVTALGMHLAGGPHGLVGRRT